MMKGYDIVYDISVLLGAEAIDYPGFPPYSMESIASMKEGKLFNLSKLVMIAHAGTHIDTPTHFFPDRKHIDDYPVERFILPAQVIGIKDKAAIRPSELENRDIKPGDALLFKTDNSISGRCASGVFCENYVYMTPEAADFCVEKKISLFGIDYVTTDKHGDTDFPAHHKLLGNDILILEGINLKEVPPGRYILFCLPLKMKGVEASPVRAILVR